MLTRAADIPRIMAIADVRLAAPQACRDTLITFYCDVVGLEPLDQAGASEVVFRGVDRRGPRLIVELDERRAEPSMRRDVVIHAGSLTELAGRLVEQDIAFAWSRGWSFYDRRLIALDPAGHRVELVTSHGF